VASEAPRTFEIGLAMAGAVSAGAYSAGVVDFLIEALDQWDQARGQPDIPDHRVVIKVMSGASAGAITGALGVIALAGGLRPQENRTSGVNIRSVLPNLYQAWVIKPCMVATSGSDLLSREDLDQQQGGPIAHSLLNAHVLDTIRDGALVLPARGQPMAFVAKDLHVYLTLTNLRGIPYAESFAGGSYGMQTHGDRAHYVVSGVGSADAPSVWASQDAGTKLDASGLFSSVLSEWRAFASAAVASGAFPVGLAPRLIRSTTESYRARHLPIDLDEHAPGTGAGASATVVELIRVTPAWPRPWFNDKPRDFDYLSVDGGVINNQPFEYARFSLMKNPPEPNESDGAKADRAVIMVDPFPAPPSFLADGKPNADLASTLTALIPALINQARFKPAELMSAASESIFSRFLIAPHRQLPGKPSEEPYAIACGLLSGFGGFLDEAFRRHDFQLGRRNCQRFLQEVFALPPENEIVSGAAAVKFQTTPEKPGDTVFRCIVPLVGSAKDEVVLPPWPRMAASDFETLQTRIKQRFDAVVPVLIDQQTRSRILRLTLRVAAWIGRGRVLDYVRYAILSDLVRRDQIAGWELPAALENAETRTILAEFANPTFDLRTVAGLAQSTTLDKARIAAILETLAKIPGKPYSLWQTTRAGVAAYTLESRKPPLWRRALAARGVADSSGQAAH
jgi:hypothetical protein